MKKLLTIMFFLLLIPMVTAETCPRGSTTIANGLIRNGPYIITQPGDYCLDDSLYVNYGWAQRYGSSVIVVQTRDVTINLNGNFIINQDGSSWLQARWTPVTLRAIELSYNSPIIGDMKITNGKIIGFDQGIYEVTLGGRGETDQIIVRNIEFIDNSNSIYVAPRRADLTKNQLHNNYLNAIIAWGLTVQYADEVEITNNHFLNLIRPINVDYSTKIVVSENYLDNLNLNQRSFSKGIFLSGSKGLVERNKIKHFNYGVEASYGSYIDLVENKGCDISYPAQAYWQSFINSRNNLWFPYC